AGAAPRKGREATRTQVLGFGPGPESATDRIRTGFGYRYRYRYRSDSDSRPGSHATAGRLRLPPPGPLPLGGGSLSRVGYFFPPSQVSSFDWIASGVKPKCFATSAAGALSPKSVMPTTRPSLPTYFHQLIGWPASTAAVRVAGGSTLSRYDAGCSSKSVVH